MTSKQEQVLKIQLEYFYDGMTMGRAVTKANKQFQEQNKINLKKMGATAHKEQVKLGEEAVAYEKRKLKVLEDLRIRSIKQSMAAERVEYTKQKRFIQSYAQQVGGILRTAATKGGGLISSFMGKIGTVAMYGAAISAITALGAAVRGAVNSFIEMEDAFVSMAAKTAMSPKDLKLTSEAILDVAVATQFTTVAITEAATALGKLGFTAKETRDMLPGVAYTAAATGESLDKVAKSMGAVMNAFGMDSERSTSVGDRLTLAFRTSALDLDKFATAFNYVGAAAASTGTSLDEVTSAMSILADRGVTASKMGTGLRKIFVRLAEEGMSLGDVIKEMSENNITFSDSVALVGQIGATQLKILADNYDDFQDNLAASNNAFGASMLAAAQQQETVMKTWLRIKNIAANIFAPGVGSDSDDWTAADWGWGKAWSDEVEYAALSLSDSLGKTEDAVGEYYKRLANIFLVQEKFRKEFAAERDKGTDMTQWLKEELTRRGVAPDSTFMSQYMIEALNQSMADFDAQGVAERFVQGQERALREVLKVAAKIRDDEGPIEANKYLRKASSGFKAGSNDWMSVLDAKTSEDQTKRMDAQRQLLTSTQALQKDYDDLLDTEVGAWKRRAGEIDTITKELCGNAPSWYLEKWEIECPAKKAGRRTSKREALPFDMGSEEEFLKRQAELVSEYGLTDDPVEKDRINKELLDLEQAHYAGKLMIIEDYISKQDSLLANANLSTADRADIEANKTSGQKADTSITKKALDSVTNRLTKEHEIKQKAWKVEQADANLHNARMKQIDSEYDLAQTPELKQKKLDEKRQIVVDYYDKQLQSQKKYLELAKKNVKDALGTDVDVSDSQAVIDNFETVQATTMAARNYTMGSIDETESGEVETQEEIDKKAKEKAIKNARAAVEIAAAVADIYKDIAQDRLDLLQDNYDREVQLLEDKYAKEKEVRDSAVASGIISQEDAARAEILSERKKNIKMNRMAEKLFEQKKKAAIEALIIDGIIGAAMAAVSMLGQGMPWAAPVMAGLALAASGVAVAAEKRKKYVPQIFAEGGMVNGPSHSQGGVPFSVAGHGGYEMEGGEYIVNKQAVKDNFDLLESINGKVNTRPTYFAAGGYVPTASNTADTDLNVAMIEALNRPVRAYVTDQDLSTSESERRALETKSTY